VHQNKGKEKNRKNTTKQNRLGILLKQPKNNNELLEKYHQYLRLNYHKKTTIDNYYYHVRKFVRWINKPINQITQNDMLNWKEYITHTFKINGNTRRIYSVNHFVRWIGKWELTVPLPKGELINRKVLSEKELNDYLWVSKSDSLLHVIALLQIDGVLRPSEISQIKISNIDLDNHRLYFDSTKTGNNYIIISPRLKEAIENYLPYRKPLPEYSDFLIIGTYGYSKGKATAPQGTFIRHCTKKIARLAGITKHITPYTIRASAITNDFNNNVNPLVIQRKCRHKQIEYTLRYCHIDDDAVLKHFKIQKVVKPTMKNDAISIGTNKREIRWIDNHISFSADNLPGE